MDEKKNQIDPFQLWFSVQPRIVNPNQTKRKRQKHHERIPVKNDGYSA
jgi:hypothetical protein